MSLPGSLRPASNFTQSSLKLHLSSTHAIGGPVKSVTNPSVVRAVELGPLHRFFPLKRNRQRRKTPHLGFAVDETHLTRGFRRHIRVKHATIADEQAGFRC